MINPFWGSALLHLPPPPQQTQFQILPIWGQSETAKPLSWDLLKINPFIGRGIIFNYFWSWQCQIFFWDWKSWHSTSLWNVSGASQTGKMRERAFDVGCFLLSQIFLFQCVENNHEIYRSIYSKWQPFTRQFKICSQPELSLDPDQGFVVPKTDANQGI